MSKSINSGSHHWIAQRATALLLLPLLVWLVFKVNFIIKNPEIIGDFIGSPIRMSLLLLLIMTSFYHANLGLKTVFEDYVSSKCIRGVLILMSYAISVFTIMVTIFSIITIHLL